LWSIPTLTTILNANLYNKFDNIMHHDSQCGTLLDSWARSVLYILNIELMNQEYLHIASLCKISCPAIQKLVNFILVIIQIGINFFAYYGTFIVLLHDHYFLGKKFLLSRILIVWRFLHKEQPPSRDISKANLQASRLEVLKNKHFTDQFACEFHTFLLRISENS
jgi:hypothetical protein